MGNSAYKCCMSTQDDIVYILEVNLKKLREDTPRLNNVYFKAMVDFMTLLP